MRLLELYWNNYLNTLELDTVDNSNIGQEYLNKKDLHLINRESGKLAINFLNKIRNLWPLTSVNGS